MKNDYTFKELWERLPKAVRDGIAKCEQNPSYHPYEKYMKDNEGKFISLYEFSDNEGESILEHGSVFYKVEHTRTSHH